MANGARTAETTEGIYRSHLDDVAARSSLRLSRSNPRAIASVVRRVMKYLLPSTLMLMTLSCRPSVVGPVIVSLAWFLLLYRLGTETKGETKYFNQCRSREAGIVKQSVKQNTRLFSASAS